MKKSLHVWITCLLLASFLPQASAADANQPWLVFEPKSGSGKGKHVVLLAGDEEYRSEEALPMLGKILSQRHGFKCTVLFSVNPDGTINPDKQDSLTNSSALDSADAIIMLLRFRKWPDADMKHFADAYKRGVPIIALRTSTHAFQFPATSGYKEYSNFGERVFGEEWVSHWGHHKVEATRGIVEAGAESHPILQGVKEVFGNSDVYEAYPPADAAILMRGQVLKGMNPTDEPATYRKKRASDKQEQAVNDPMMAVAWTRERTNDSGKVNRIFTTTLGAATDLQNEGLRRMVVNAVFWGLNMKVPQMADVNTVGAYRPTMYGFGTFRKGVRPAEYGLEPVAKKEPAAPKVELKQGDHIAILGNALPDRMQHSGYFETLLHAALPKHELVVRTLATAGDEVSTWYRSENFGTRNEWLSKVKADVIFAFYGTVEANAGEAGVEKFRADLVKFIDDMRAANFSGKGSPRLVLFTPIAREQHSDSVFPNADRFNPNLARYSEVMEEVAKAKNVGLVDLYRASQQLFAGVKKGESLTVNGLYLTDKGDQQFAPHIIEALLGTKPRKVNEKLLQAVNEKNRQWHQRYRTIDGYNVFGGRSALAYQPGKGPFITDRTPPEPYISNFQVMQQEMSQRDVLTANRDLLVWAVANGRTHQVDDSNLPAVTKVPTNKPGPEPDGAPKYLSGLEAMSKMTLHSGTKINLFADEVQFPELVNPVQMAWDTKGRLWVAAWLNYPERRPTSLKGDSLVVLEDTNQDGKADKLTTFANDLNAPTGFQFYKDGVIVVQAPDIWFMRDTDGDGKADYKERVLMGLDSADSHHTANAICLDNGGAIYLSDGVFHRSQMETIHGVLRNSDAGIYRFEPRTTKLEMYINYGFANPHGRVFDRWGNDFVTDATGNNTYFGAAISGYLDPHLGKHASVKQFWDRPSRPCPGTAMLTSRHFPEEFQGNFLNCNVISFQGIFRVKVSEDGSGVKGETLENIISSSDPNFRPSVVNVGPDGALYIADWHNSIIGHMQHHIRDPNRMNLRGRIYRMTYENRPLLKQPKIDGQPIPKLLDLLKEHEDSTRELAKIELGERDSAKVVAAAKSWVKGLDQSAPGYEHQLLEALWVQQWHHQVDRSLLERVLKSPEPKARAAAARVLWTLRDQMPDSLTLFRKLAEDENPRVRLEAVRAASYYRSPEAAEVALAVLKKPMDYYLDYTLGETLRQLEPIWKKALTESKTFLSDNAPGAERVVRSVPTADLAKLPQSAGVLVATLSRADSTDDARITALSALARDRKTSLVAELLSLVKQLESRDAPSAGRLARLLPLLDNKALLAEQASLRTTATESSSPVVRQAAWASLAVAEGSFDKIWMEASQSPSALIDLVGGIPVINDAEFRAKAYPRVSKFLVEPSQPSATKTPERAPARFVRIELPRKGTLTLAEVQVFSGGRNVALQGKAKQSTTAHGGSAERAIDGKTDGAYANGSQTHTEEEGTSAWWEVDLGQSVPVESVVVWNRSEGNGQYAKRLDGFTLRVLDGNRAELFKQAAVPAPSESVKLTVSVGAAPNSLRRAAIQALVSMPVNQETTFNALADLLVKGDDLVAAAQGIGMLPRNSWNGTGAARAAQALVAGARKVPEGERTSQDYVETIQLAADLAGFLPEQQAAALRKELKGLRVAVYVIRTVREQMRFDLPRIVVEAGKPFELIVENPDFMPHNLVVVKPGTREKVGQAAETMRVDALDNQGRAYVPRTSDVIAATKLLESGQRAVLKITAPNAEGISEYVCTFPGHWQSMFGQLVVTKDVDDYLLKNPKAIIPTAAPHQHE